MGTPRITDPTRTALEQLLLSTAADRAVEKIMLEALAGKKVFLDSSGFIGVDTAYVVTQVSILLGKYGALIVGDKKDAEAVAVFSAGSFSIDRSDSFVGIPSFPIPIPLTGTINTPEIAIFKNVKQTGVAKFALNVYEISTGRQILAVAPVYGNAYNNFHKMFFVFSYRTTDIPEKKKGWWSQP